MEQPKDRIKIVTTYNGKTVKQIDIDKNPIISTLLPSSYEVNVSYQTILKRAEKNQKNYKINVSENGIIVQEF